MKVAHLITRLILGGAQENTLQTVENQQLLHGDDVTLITGPAIGPEGSLLERSQRGTHGTIVLPELTRSIHPLKDAIAYRRIVQLLGELQPDIVHTHSSKAGILGRAAAARLRLPCVHTIHGAAFHYGQSALTYRAYVLAEKQARRWTDKFISVADDMTTQYLSEGIGRPEDYVTIRSGFDVEPFLHPPREPLTVRAELGLSSEDIVVGKIGRLFHLKGHEFLIQAAPAVAAAHPRVKFLLVGDGILRESLQQEIARLGLSERFVFTGLVPPDRIPELMGAMDIVVHTSQWEGLARVLPQGLIAGKPVVSYDVGGAREVVIPDVTGFLLPRDSVTELSAALVKLVQDPALRQRMGAAGRARCASEYRHQTMSSRIQSVYEEVLRKKRKLPASTVRIFAYGTLKRGLCRHHFLAGQKFIAEARTAPRYRMYNLGTYPGLVDAPQNGLSIHGEIWEVDAACLARMDVEEGVAERLYERRAIELLERQHGPVQAYFSLQDVSSLPDCGDCWE